MTVTLSFFFISFFFLKRQQDEDLVRNNQTSRVGQKQKRLPGRIDEVCTTLVDTNMSLKKKKKEETGSKFKCNYCGYGKSVSELFDDKNLELLK
jgi:hypothetical protein